MLGQLPIVDVLVVVSFFCTGRMKLLKPTCYFFFSMGGSSDGGKFRRKREGKIMAAPCEFVCV